MGKWLGAYRLVPPLAILPVLVVLGTGLPGDYRQEVALLMAGFVLSSGAAVTSLGLAVATWCPRLGRALGITVSLYLLITAGWLFAVVAIQNDFQSRSLMMGSLWFWSGMMTAGVRQGFLDDWTPAYNWTLAYALAALVLLAATMASFNRCLGRVDGRPLHWRRSLSGAFTRSIEEPSPCSHR
jgi:ABC-type transport system involved in multi-copper enzyme maturation permease subunit